MTFKLGDENYALPILTVREIIGLMEVTRVPRTAEYVRGVINLRGRVIPVVDLRVKFGMPAVEATDQTVIIVVQYAHASGDLTIGLLVDQVVEVLDIAVAQIEPPPKFGVVDIDTNFLLGVGKAGDRVTFLLDTQEVLSFSESENIRLLSDAGA